MPASSCKKIYPQDLIGINSRENRELSELKSKREENAKKWGCSVWAVLGACSWENRTLWRSARPGS